MRSFRIEHGARTDDHFILVLLRQSFDDTGRTWHGERYFERGNPAFGTRFSDARSVIGDIRANDGNKSGVDDLIKNKQVSE